MGSLAFCNLKRIMEENGIPPNGIVHVGAHKGEELGIYAEIGFPHIYLFEPNPGVYDELCEAVRKHALPKGGSISVDRIAIGKDEGTVGADFYVPARSQLASLDEESAGEGAEHIKVMRAELRDFNFFDSNVLVVDTQGTELDVLKSGDLTQFDLIVVEAHEVTISAFAIISYLEMPYYPKQSYAEALRFDYKEMFRHDHDPHLLDLVFVKRRPCKPRPSP